MKQVNAKTSMKQITSASVEGKSYVGEVARNGEVVSTADYLSRSAGSAHGTGIMHNICFGSLLSPFCPFALLPFRPFALSPFRPFALSPFGRPSVKAVDMTTFAATRPHYSKNKDAVHRNMAPP
jgi:hypothetical protein